MTDAGYVITAWVVAFVVLAVYVLRLQLRLRKYERIHASERSSSD